jgi:hypothetical protein
MRTLGDSNFVFDLTGGYIQKNYRGDGYPYDLFIKKE